MSVLTPLEVRTALRMKSSDQDAELATVIAAAEKLVAGMCGPLEPTACTAVVEVDECGRAALPQAPVLSVTSGTEVFTRATLTVADVVILDGGVIARVPAGTWRITWQAGRTSLPDDLRQGAIEVVRRIWARRNGPTARPGTATPLDAAALLSGTVATLIGGDMAGGFS